MLGAFQTQVQRNEAWTIHLATELLLQLPDEPGVNFLEGLAQAVGDVDHHSLPVPGNVHLAAKTKPSSAT